MRAVVVRRFGDLDSAELEEVPDPLPGDDEVVVGIRATPVNYVDLVILRGEYQFTPDLPYIPGKGPAGVVVDVGSAVNDVGPGDRVLAMAEAGGYAEQVAVHHQQVYQLPPQLGFTEAAAMSLAYDTAWMALRDRARLEPGESVLVLGASGAVGQATIQLARVMGAGLILAGVSNRSRPSGPYDEIVDLSGPDLRSTVRAQVHEATNGRGADVVIDPVGGDAFGGALRSVAWHGRLVVVGFASGRIPTMKMNYPLLKNIEVSGLQISDYRKYRPDLMKECFREIFQFCSVGAITPPASATQPLAEWKAALQTVAAGDDRRRLVLLPRPNTRAGKSRSSGGPTAPPPRCT